MAASRGAIILQSLSNKVKQETRKVFPSSSENSILGHNSYGSNASNSMRQIPTSRITDLVLGHLSPEESLRVLEEIQKSGELSEELAWLVQNNVPISYVKEILGHASVSTTLIYAHSTTEHLRESLFKIDSMLVN